MNTTPTKPTNRKIVFLTFPQSIAGQPIVCNLTRMFDLCFNIQDARVTPRKEGFMVLEIFGEADKFDQGIGYLKERGVLVSSAAQRVTRDEEACTHCGMCTALCLTDALAVDKDTRRVEFHLDKCSACGLCSRICPVRAMGLDAEYGDLED